MNCLLFCILTACAIASVVLASAHSSDNVLATADANKEVVATANATSSKVVLQADNASKIVDPSKVVIVLSRGRSGSTELCGLVENIVRTSLGNELFGSDFEMMSRVEDPLALMLSYLSNRQAEYPGKTVGFKYKSYIVDKQYEPVWDWVSQNNVKVVKNYRNPLDVMISRVRLLEDEAVAHCPMFNAACVKKQRSIKVHFNVTNILSDLEALKLADYELMVLLIKQNINYFDVTYEDLNQKILTDRLAYIQAMADFLLPGKRLTANYLNAHIQYIGHLHQNETVLNYGELQAALKGTRFWRYLH